ncbi:MAG: DsbA family protein [Pseudomonadota bacterium]
MTTSEPKPVESLDEAVARVMGEADEWRQIMSQDAERTIKVYLDIKSPHAYIAVRPSLELARDYAVNLDICPYLLSYTSMGISTSVESDKRRRPPSEVAERRARMFYAAARQYTALQQIPLRSPYRLLDTALALRVFIFAKQQSLEVPFYMHVNLRGWGSGWRDFEVESLDQLRSAFADIGGDVTGLEDFVAPGGPGEQELARYVSEAEASGFVGTPHYVFEDTGTGRQVGLFGREHLALIRSKLAADGLARRDDVDPAFSHAWCGPGT